VTPPLPISLDVNGERVDAYVLPRFNLADFLREHLHLTGTHVGCEHGVCGACTVNLDGKLIRSCLTLAVQADGCDVQTIEGAGERESISLLQSEFHKRNAAQCGFCTPAMLLTAAALVEQPGSVPSRETIREHLSGNLCRCTGYQSIVDAVEAVCVARGGARS
jgi:aerobic carbon-monoxide dehydrogenase small subunit